MGGEPKEFCCPGCKAVYEILVSKYGELPQKVESTELFRLCKESGLLGQSGGKAPRSGSAAGVEASYSLELWFKISGMSCPSCSWLLERLLEKVKGVKEAEVSFGTELSHILYDPSLVTPGELMEKISSWGYQALPVQEGDEERIRAPFSLRRVVVAALLTCQVMMISWAVYWGFLEELGQRAVSYLSVPIWVLSTPVIFWCGFPVMRRGIAAMRAWMPNVETLVSLASLSAYLYSMGSIFRGSLHLYFDTGCMLVTTVLLGRYVEERMRAKLRDSSFLEMARLGFLKARVWRRGQEEWVPASRVEKGQEIEVREGETIPVDGIVTRGQAMVDNSSLTGESRPVALARGSPALAGAIVLQGRVFVLASGPWSASLLGEMVSSVMEAMKIPTSWDNLAQKGLRWFVPGVIALGLSSSLWLVVSGQDLKDALMRGLTVWAVACPCALGIAIPVAKSAAIALGRKRGIVVRNPEILERGGRLDEILLDKTGTVTHGNFEMREIHCPEENCEELLSIAASLEAASEHLIAKRIVASALERGIRLEQVQDFHEEQGSGVRGLVGKRRVFVGSEVWMRRSEQRISPALLEKAREYQSKGFTVVFVAWDGSVKGLLAMGDALRDTASWLVQELVRRGMRVRLISGDSKVTTSMVARELGLEDFSGEATPSDKARIVEELKGEGKMVAAVGDGFNDGPALALAHMGIAVGRRARGPGGGADVWIPGGELEKILEALDLCKKARRTVIENLVLSGLYNSVALAAALGGLLTPFVAVGAMFLSSLTVVANSWRLSRCPLGAHALELGKTPFRAPSCEALQA